MMVILMIKNDGDKAILSDNDNDNENENNDNDNDSHKNKKNKKNDSDYDYQSGGKPAIALFVYCNCNHKLGKCNGLIKFYTAIAQYQYSAIAHSAKKIAYNN